MEKINAVELQKRIAAARLPLVAVMTRKNAAPSEELLRALQDVEPELKGRVDLVNLDMDQNSQLMDELKVHKVPEMLIYARGRVVERTAGAMDGAQVKALIEHVLQRIS